MLLIWINESWQAKLVYFTIQSMNHLTYLSCYGLFNCLLSWKFHEHVGQSHQLQSYCQIFVSAVWNQMAATEHDTFNFIILKYNEFSFILQQQLKRLQLTAKTKVVFAH